MPLVLNIVSKSSKLPIRTFPSLPILYHSSVCVGGTGKCRLRENNNNKKLNPSPLPTSVTWQTAVMNTFALSRWKETISCSNLVISSSGLMDAVSIASLPSTNTKSQTMFVGLSSWNEPPVMSWRSIVISALHTAHQMSSASF